VTRNFISPSVANLSGGGPVSDSLDEAVRGATTVGVTFVVSAGNDATDVRNQSPARVIEAITVGATDVYDARWPSSNFGPGVDVFAPGVNILSAGIKSDTDSRTMSGTSMAAPHVAGIVALYLEGNPTSVSTVRFVIEDMATPYVVSNAGSGSPNHFTYSRWPTVRRGLLFRYYNTGNDDHFYTMDWNELQGGRDAYLYEGVQAYTVHGLHGNLAGTVPLYRYYNSGSGDHFMTTNWNELGWGAGGWGYEGINAYVPTVTAADTTPLYRYYNTVVGKHFYTTNWAELGGGGSGGWVYEGIACLVYTVP